MFVVQHDLMNLSINIPNDDFKEFVDTLVAAQQAMDSARARWRTSTRSSSERLGSRRWRATNNGV